jgi:hypothetical protein
MGKVTFKKKGFTGLTDKGKLICVVIFVIVALIGWVAFNAGPDNILGILKAAGLAIAVAWISQFFLPRDTYFYTEHFCADCGNYLGYSGKVCDRCGCNRYTTNDSGVGRTVRNR